MTPLEPPNPLLVQLCLHALTGVEADDTALLVEEELAEMPTSGAAHDPEHSQIQARQMYRKFDVSIRVESIRRAAGLEADARIHHPNG